MIEINTYLRTTNGRFSLVENVETPPSGSDYVEGAIELTINGIPIIDQKMWDYVDQLWAYISEMVADLQRGDEASTYFPDQPIKLAFTRKRNGRILVSIDDGEDFRSTSIEEDELVMTLRGHASAFFEKMERLIPANTQSYRRAFGFLG